MENHLEHVRNLDLMFNLLSNDFKEEKKKGKTLLTSFICRGYGHAPGAP